MSARARASDSVAPALLLGFLFCGVAYLFTGMSALPRFYYLPVEGAWTWTQPVEGIAMGYYGLLLNGAIGFAVGAALGRVPPVRRWLSGSGAAVVPWLALADLWLVMAWFGISEIARWGSM